MPTLSVIVITKNEAHNIGDCLKSVSFGDELIVLDSGSTDATVELANARGARVEVRSDWLGFGIQKNRALTLASCEWILSIDADERVSALLHAEIDATLRSPSFDAYSFPRRSSYCGQVISHSGWSPDRVTRLFRRGSATFSNDLVHEKLLTASEVGKLKCALEHESYRNLEEVLHKANRYSSAGAASLYQRGRQASLGIAVAHALWAFIRSYFFRLGLLDGRLGFVLATSIAHETYFRYLKLWMLNRKNGRLQG